VAAQKWCLISLKLLFFSARYDAQFPGDHAYAGTFLSPALATGGTLAGCGHSYQHSGFDAPTWRFHACRDQLVRQRYGFLLRAKEQLTARARANDVNAYRPLMKKSCVPTPKSILLLPCRRLQLQP
jgi:hypothetical protein